MIKKYHISHLHREGQSELSGHQVTWILSGIRFTYDNTYQSADMLQSIHFFSQNKNLKKKNFLFKTIYRNNVRSSDVCYY